ncbi:MAG: hypothetical protein A3J81_01590 [Nitrospirae bacterium RIFOXYB2_FULL_43_5]|nr:MAG: hypothetical protein A2X54_08935 [Nitrospirae bacterium GWF2_44_13]OGW33766.1 MAG: hypothetical protein A2088_00530 [Nitrospirae bacterium GWD2_44_7]OGW65777.1 MAG: hypothetical protein A2222_05535 [Nitrospirae bacterium RIFOXYA2_FULL_44_9]OGW73316.1 MAG: hypothetical protein A3J81_01590 [Nitrospirae bacterium RIFOXYB2_FULL_43_5]OGW73912.1 MAG: hypothetical protein A2484_07960 [Nitrospirae bacterium RIFOXYC2_FULL_44_7]HBG92732.1 hypothetical protein [Nitrospiraceae bacterium]
MRKGYLILVLHAHLPYIRHPEHMGKCTGCALCAQMCPELAIEVWAENNPDKSGLAEESRKKKA